MQFLQDVLDDPHAEPCGRCSVCTSDLPGSGRSPNREEVSAAKTFLRGADEILEPRKKWPPGFRKPSTIIACSEGRAVAYADDPAWKDEIDELRRLRNRSVPQEFLAGGIATLRRWAPQWSIRPTRVVPAPAPVMDANRELAAHVARLDNMTVNDVFSWTGPSPTEAMPSLAMAQHLEEAISMAGSLDDSGPVLLVTTTARTMWTLTIAGALLREAGASDVLPLVLHLQV